MDFCSYRNGSLLALTLVACAPEPVREPALEEPDTSTRGGIEGANCAGAAPAMAAPDGVVYPFQSVVAYYYKVLEAYWVDIDGESVLQTWLPAAIEATSEAFYAWQAKSVQIYQDKDLFGFAHRYYMGMFGFLAAASGPSTCTPALDDAARLSGLLGHVGLSQAGICGQNDDGTDEFWQVEHIFMFQRNQLVDTRVMMARGLAMAVEHAPADRCILAADPMAPSPIGMGSAASPEIPCRVAFRPDAVTEAVVLPIRSPAYVAGVALEYRPFTAAGTVSMPNDLNMARSILRSDQLRAMRAIGLPVFGRPDPWLYPAAGPDDVQVIGHRVGPTQTPSAVLLPDELLEVEARVGKYADRCCRLQCGKIDGTIATAVGSGGGSAPPPCETVCEPEGTCATGMVVDGLAVVVADVTKKKCSGSCPEPATSAPTTEPVCEPACTGESCIEP